MDVASVTASTQAVQSAFNVISTLALTSFLYPPAANNRIRNDSSYDYIIVGGGTTGSVLTNRLTEDPTTRVLLVEAGDDPPLETMLPSLFPYHARTKLDWNFTSQDDGYTARQLKNNVVNLVQGKMLGGSSSLDHLFYVRGNPADYAQWAAAVSDDSWNWDGLYEYFLKGETVVDDGIRNSPDAQFHGFNGPVQLTRPHFDNITQYLQAFEELGYRIVSDLNANETLGYGEPFFSINEYRQSSAYAYLRPIRERANLTVLKNAFVTRILYWGIQATGVQILLSTGETIVESVSREVIVAAGAFNSPKLLMLSGIGPRDHLESLGINVLADLPVGQNLQDHLGVIVVHQMEVSDAPIPASDPRNFPAPSFLGHVALKETQSYPDYHSMGIIFPHDSGASAIPFCSTLFGYKDEICQAVVNANIGRNMVVNTLKLLHPKSRGQVRLASTDPFADPIITLGAFSNNEDLENDARYLKDYNRVLQSTYFKNVNASFVDLNIPACAVLEADSIEYWKCYALNMGASVFHYVGTCSMGSVVDANLNVIGMERLRVVDSSVIPYIVSGNPRSAVTALAEKAADLIKRRYVESDA